MPNRPIIVIQNISKSRAVRIKQDGAVKLKRIMNSKNRTKNHRTMKRTFVNLGIGTSALELELELELILQMPLFPVP